MTTHAYDAANQRTNTTDRTGTNRWLTFYTLRGKVERVTDPLGHTVTNTHDAANRLIRVTDPLGQSVTNRYDANGNLVASFDKLGQRWSKTYDRLNRVLAETDPLGNTRQTAYDVAGRIRQTTTPNGFPSLHSYDGRGRLTKWTDAEGFDWLYTYDGNGNITDIEDALHGHYVMEYGPRNERTLERNQDDFEWRYEYDELLRLERQTDPNRTTRTPTYGAAGRVLFVDFSTGRQDSFVYDDNDNPRTISRRYAGVTTRTQFIYDALDRPTEQTDAHGKTVLYGYDPLGRVTALTYPGGNTLTNRYDALGRLTNQVDWAGREMTYAYDPADRLTRRTYPNGVAQTNTLDTAGRLTDLKYSIADPKSNSIAIALSYAYDHNGNKTGSSEKGTLEWPLPTLTDERADYTAAGRLKTRTISMSATNALPSPGGEGQGEGGTHSSVRYLYDPSGNLTNAVGNGQSWTLAYDEDNRTLSIDWEIQPLTSKRILNRYDALGRRVARTVDGVTTGYVLSLAGGMERILCDLDNAGNVTAWYVHGPDLGYRVDAATNFFCYHAGAMANVIALTGPGGANLAQYAYTPYGRSLGSSAISNLQSRIPNPYLFVGSQGVMEELPGLYFMRARYYSADAGVFLSTDPVKHIGPGWKTTAYAYAEENPMSGLDPQGRIVINTILDSGVTYSADFTPIVGVSVEGSISREGIKPFRAQQTIGLSLGASESVEALGIYGGTSADWEKYDKVDFSLKALGGIGFTVARSYTGEWGVSVSGSVGPAVGITFRVTMSDPILRQSPSGATTLSSPTAGTTPMAVLKPVQSSATPFGLPAAQISPANHTVSSRTAAAGATASSITTVNSAATAAPSAGSGSTSSGGTSITIPRGATLSGLAQQYGTTMSGLMAANPQITNPNLIYAGARLTVPSSNTGNFGGFRGGRSGGGGASGRWP